MDGALWICSPYTWSICYTYGSDAVCRDLAWKETYNLLPRVEVPERTVPKNVICRDKHQWQIVLRWQDSCVHFLIPYHIFFHDKWPLNYLFSTVNQLNTNANRKPNPLWKKVSFAFLFYWHYKVQPSYMPAYLWLTLPWEARTLREFTASKLAEC